MFCPPPRHPEPPSSPRRAIAAAAGVLPAPLSLARRRPNLPRPPSSSPGCALCFTASGLAGIRVTAGPPPRSRRRRSSDPRPRHRHQSARGELNCPPVPLVALAQSHLAAGELPCRRKVSHPILQGKPNASHVCARIIFHTHDRQNESNTIAVINRSRVKPIRYSLLHPERWTRRSEHSVN
jgi:hypothetical protein